jgi:hypothetical protein
VYADWLQEQGDPRGELIHVQAALELPGHDPARRAELQAREAALLEAHRAQLTGPLGPVLDKEFEHVWIGKPTAFFRRGFIDELVLPRLSSAAIDALQAFGEARFIRNLEVHGVDYDDEPELSRLGETDLIGLRHLVIGDPRDQCHLSCEDVALVRKCAPRLEYLGLYAHRVPTRELFALQLPHLRELFVHHVYDYPLDVLAANPSLTGLQRLDLYPHALEYDHEPYLTEDSIAQLTAEGSHLTGLRHLALRLCTAGDAGVQRLVEWPGFRKLQTLALVYGEITDAGARMLAEAGLDHLAHLDLSGNSLTEAGVAVLSQTGVDLAADEQTSWGEEREYLWYGDME